MKMALVALLGPVVLLSSFSFSGPIRIWTPLEGISVQPYSGSTTLSVQSIRSAQFQAPTQKTYAWAIFRRALNLPTRKRLEATMGIRFLGVHDVDAGSVIYRVCFNRALAAVQQELSGSVIGFVNVVPIRSQDKMTRKILQLQGFKAGERDSISGKIFAQLDFFEDVPIRTRDSLVREFIGGYLNRTGDGYTVKALPAALASLSSLPEIRMVREKDMEIRPLNDVSKNLTGVSSIQTIDFSVFPPDTSWMTNDSLTGDSVIIGIGENIDDLHPDFREAVACTTGEAPPCTRLRNGRPDLTWQSDLGCTGGASCGHGTHTAAIAAGNGRMSETAGGTRYQWRGVAPKALLTTNGDVGDINSHSFGDGGVGVYSPGADQATWNHPQSAKIFVVSAGNNGNGAEYCCQVGFYSLLSNAKNYTVVGAVFKETPAIAPFSSLGPTRDGRIGVTVVSPGASLALPIKRPTPMRVEVDSIAIYGPGRINKKSWDFSTGTEGWYDRFEMDSVRDSSGILVGENDLSEGWFGWTDTTAFTPASSDTMFLSVRVLHPQFPDSVSSINAWVSIQAPQSGSNVDPTLHFTVPTGTADSLFILLRVPLAGMPNYLTTGPIDSLILSFGSDTVDAIYSAALTSLPTPYVYIQGTSMSAPHASGIVALMLDKYNRNYLRPVGKSIRTSAPWNSSIKAVLAHTAKDLIKTGVESPYETDINFIVGSGNPDIRYKDSISSTFHLPVPIYYRGPDYTTGWGLVQAPGAIAHVDTNLFKQDSIDQAEEMTFTFHVSAPDSNLKVTLAWDDFAGNVSSPQMQSKLINDLDLLVIGPDSVVHRPWVLNPLPQAIGPMDTDVPSNGLDPIDSADVQPAYRGPRDSLNNLERVDVDGIADTGTWTIRVKGTRVPLLQHFSLVADRPLIFVSKTTDSTLLDSLAFVKFPEGITRIVTDIAIRESDSTVFFVGLGPGDVGYALVAFNLSENNVRWSYPLPTPANNELEFARPVLGGDKIVQRFQDSLLCLRDLGTSAIVVWKSWMPSNVALDSTIDSTDTASFGPGVHYFTTSAISDPPVEITAPAVALNLTPPPVDQPRNLLIASVAHQDSIWKFCSPKSACPELGDTLPGDTVIYTNFIYPASSILIYDLDSGIFFREWPAQLLNPNPDTSFPSQPPYINTSPSASPEGSYFVDNYSVVYQADLSDDFWRVTRPPWLSNPRTPVPSQSGMVYVAGDNGVLVIDGGWWRDSINTLQAGVVMGELVLSDSEDVIFASYDNVTDSTYINVFHLSGTSICDTFTCHVPSSDSLPPLRIPLAQGQVSNLGQLALGNNDLVYVQLGDRLLGFDINTGEKKFDISTFFFTGTLSPPILNKLLIQVSADRRGLIGWRVTSTGLGGNWAKVGRDNGGSGFQPNLVAGYRSFGIGDGEVTESSWNPDRTEHVLCGKSSGLGGIQDNLLLSGVLKTGDFEISAKVDSLSATDPEARAGLMALSTATSLPLPDDGVNGFVWVASANWGGFSHRDTTGGQTSTQAALGNFDPSSAWVKLRRQGEFLSALISDNGLHFTKIGEMAVPPGPLLVGPAQTSGNSSLVGCAEYRSIALGMPSSEALFVVGNPALTSADATVKSRLETLGYTVTVRDDGLVQTSDADNKDLVVVSSTSNSSSIGTKFTSVAVPVLSWEPALMDELGMAGTQGGVDQGIAYGQTKIKIVNSTHPLADGLPSGVHTVLSSPDTMSFAKPNSHAVKVATIWNDTTKSVIFGYEQGTALIGSRSPARRTGFFLYNKTASKLNAIGWQLFDAAVKWSTGPVNPSALLVVGNIPVSPADAVIQSHLQGLGYLVTMKTAPAHTGSTGPLVVGSDANGKNVVVISSTVGSGEVNTMFRTTPVPVLDFEPALYDEMGMANTGSSNQGIVSNQTQVKVLLTSSPLSGRMTGTVIVTSASAVFSFGKPNSNAVKAASIFNDTAKAVIFGYDLGSGMIGLTAPARRTGFFLNDATATSLNRSGYGFLDAALGWTTGN